MAEATIPLKPVGREEIHRLEYSLLISSLVEIITDPKFADQLRDPRDRLTWIDSIATAAAALARDKAGMSLSEIADDIGRTEATIRKHLRGETEAGRIVLEAYRKLERGELDETLSIALGVGRGDVSSIREKLEGIIAQLEGAASALRELLGELR